MELGLIINNFVPILTGLGAFIIAFFMIPVIIDVSYLKHLFDDPSNDRKLHIHKTPNLGGVAIFGSVFIAFALSGYATASWAPNLAAGLVILFFSGIKDDILVLSPAKKLGLQVLAILAVMLGGNMVATDLGGVFGLQEIPYWAGFVLTLFTMVVVVNAYNLIDGIDGLAGGIGVIASLFFGWCFAEAGMMAYAAMAISLAGALLAFIWYNFQPASIFMGDTGSQIVGYLLGFLAISAVMNSAGTGSVVPFAEIMPILVVSVLIVPLYDTIRVFAIRLFHGHSPFEPDRLHVHHQLIDIGFSHRACCYIIYGFNIAIIGLTLSLRGIGLNLLLGSVLAATVVLFPTLEFKRKLLTMLGLNLPTAQRIKTIERRYGVYRHRLYSESQTILKKENMKLSKAPKQKPKRKKVAV